jgi:hypothetical protein
MLKYEDLDNNQWIYYNEQMQVKHDEEFDDYVHLMTNYNLFDEDPELEKIIFIKFLFFFKFIL